MIKNTSYNVRPDKHTLAQIGELAPETGVIIYDTDNDTNKFWNGAIWVSLGAASVELLSFKQKSSSYTILSSDHFLEATTGTFTFTLPSAVGLAGKSFTIKNSGTGVSTIDGDGTETIDGSLDVQLTQYQSITVVSNGTNFIII